MIVLLSQTLTKKITKNVESLGVKAKFTKLTCIFLAARDFFGYINSREAAFADNFAKSKIRR